MLSRAQKITLFFSCLITVTGLMAIDFINPALPYIQNYFLISQSKIKGLIIAYLLILGSAQLFYGGFSDRYGRKTAILTGFFTAILGCVISACAETIFILYLGRVMTAIGTAAAAVISRALIADLFQDRKFLVLAFSYLAMSSQLSPAIAPIIGGVIQQYLQNWHTVFWGLAIIILLSVVTILLGLRETHIPEKNNNKNNNYKNFNLKSYFTPYYILLKDRYFTIYSLMSALVYVYTIGYYTLSPYIFHRLNFSPIENSLFYLVYAVGLVTGAYCSARLANRFTLEKILLAINFIYIFIFIIFFIIFSMIHTPIFIILSVILLSFIVSLLCGISAPFLLALSTETVNSQITGIASAVQSFIKMFFTGIILLLFNFITLYNFQDLSLLFLVNSILLLILFTIVKIR